MLCKGKDEIVAQYALTGYDQPIGISDYQLSKAIPENLKSALPRDVYKRQVLYILKSLFPVLLLQFI